MSRYRVIVDFLIEDDDLTEEEATDRVLGRCQAMVEDYLDLIEAKFGDAFPEEVEA